MKEKVRVAEMKGDELVMAWDLAKWQADRTQKAIAEAIIELKVGNIREALNHIERGKSCQ